MKRGEYLDQTGVPALWLSWSRLLEFEKCQQKFQFHQEGKGTTIKEGRNFVSGTVADRAMRQWLEQDTEHLPGQMATYVDEMWLRHTKNSEEYTVTWRKDNPKADEDSAKELAKTAVTNLEPFLFKRVLPFEYQPEWRFQTAIALPYKGTARDVVLNGGADIIVRDPETNEWFVYDLKTTRNEQYVKGPILSQLIFYQLAIKLTQDVDSYDKINTAFLTPATKIQYHSITIGSKDRQYLLNRIVRLAEFMWSEIKTPTLTDDVNTCFFCDCKSICPLYASAIEVNAKGKHKVSIADTAELRKNAKANAGLKNTTESDNSPTS